MAGAATIKEFDTIARLETQARSPHAVQFVWVNSCQAPSAKQNWPFDSEDVFLAPVESSMLARLYLLTREGFLPLREESVVKPAARFANLPVTGPCALQMSTMPLPVLRLLVLPPDVCFLFLSLRMLFGLP